MIYFVQRANGDIKIGYTGKRLENRLYEVESRYGGAKLLGVRQGDKSIESALHNTFAQYRVDPNSHLSEWFEPHENLLEYITTFTTSEDIQPRLHCDKVTIRLSHRTKRWLEAYQANEWERSGRRLNNSDAIEQLLLEVAPEVCKVQPKLI